MVVHIVHLLLLLCREQGSGILTYLQSWRTQRVDLWCGRPCRVKSQPSPSLQVPWACQKPLLFLPVRKRSAVLENSPEYHRDGKIPPPSMTLGKKRCWTISSAIETGFYFCSFLESCSCSSLLLWAWSSCFFIFRAILIFFSSPLVFTIVSPPSCLKVRGL